MPGGVATLASMRSLLLAYFLVIFPFTAFSQLKLGREKEVIPLAGNSQVSALYSSPDEGFDAILEKNFTEPYVQSLVPTPEKDVWLSFKVLNTDSFSNDYYVYSKSAYYTVYIQTDSGWHKQQNGYLLPLKKRDNKKRTFFLHIQLKQPETTQVYIRLQSGNYKRSVHTPEICTKTYYYEVLADEIEFNQPGTTFTLVYIAGLIMISFFVFILYVAVRQRLYAYYLFYLLFQLFYAILIFARTPLMFMNVALYFPVAGYALEEGVQFMFIGFYVFFILKLLEIKTYDVRLSQVMRGVAWACFAYAIFSMGYKSLLPDPDFSDWLFRVSRLIILPINFLLIIWVIVKVKHPLIGYFIVGNTFFFAGSVLSVYVALNNIYLDPESIFYFGNSLNTIFQAGLLIEVFCFSFAIAHHVQLIQKEKKKSADSYIMQLQENQRIQANMNEELDKIVTEKTNELVRVYSDIEKQKEKEIKSEFTQKIKEMEMLALRAQMNPHFLFNSMNALKHLIMTGSSDDAVQYLDDFSTLLRGVLQNSKRETITVEDELEILQLYLSLEKGRLGKEFKYSIAVADKEALSQYPIPALLLQPFVENAIWHGLMPSDKKDKWLEIDFAINEQLIITIQDNGIGRKMAAKISQSRPGIHKSFGIQITQERLALFNHLNDSRITLKVTDLKNDDGSPAGTRVTFTYSN